MRGSLLRAELGRMRSRRMTWILLLVAIAMLGMISYATYDQARPLSGVERTQAEDAFAQARAQWAQSGLQMQRDCLEQQEQARTDDATIDLHCSAMEPKLEHFVKPPARLSDVHGGLWNTMAPGWCLLAYILGASLVAAEFSSGAISTWLTFAPRRLPVFAAKAVAPAIVIAVVSALAALAMIGVTRAIVGFSGGDVSVGPDHVGTMAWGAARLSAVGTLAVLAGTAFGALFRHTAAAIGLAFFYLIVVEGIARSLLGTGIAWLVSNSLLAFVNNGWTVIVMTCSSSASQGFTCTPQEVPVSMAQGGGALAGAVVVSVMLAAWVFRRRDVA